MANPDGLHIRSFEADGFVTARFTSSPAHENGMGMLCGGIIATVLDCHSAAAMMLEAHGRGWLPRGDSTVPYVTAGLNVQYLRPMPITEVSEVRAAVVSADDTQMTVDVELLWDGKVRSRATALWKAWRPRQ
jgi:acyl-coenzyme A thioesterase PaaI-like protein